MNVTQEGYGYSSTLGVGETIVDGRLLRVSLESDPDAPAPDNDGGCPLFRVGYDGATLVYGGGYAKNHLDVLEDAIQFFWTKGSEFEVFARWVSIYHGGFTEVRHDLRRDWTYIAVLTPPVWTAWGRTGPIIESAVEMDEYEAWLDGDTYGIRVDVSNNICRCDDCEDERDWEDEDAVWGYYGDVAADAEAKQVFASYVREEDRRWDFSTT